jgi:spore germination cell wall hydrolase CwlJ-like protein
MREKARKIYAQNVHDFVHLDEAQIMALTIWREAGGEPYEGKQAVGSVILERVDHRDWDGRTIHEVCLWPYQFSCFLPDDPNRKKMVIASHDFAGAIRSDSTLSKCYDLAKGMIAKEIPRNVDAVQYLNPVEVQSWGIALPEWTRTMKKVASIGHHDFYK